MAGVVNLISRRPTTEPIHEFLFNRSSLGETDASMFLASQLTPHWGASLLGGAYLQEHQDVNGDGWADVAGYSRGVFRPRVYWDNKQGGTAQLTGGVIYEDRSGGTVSGALLPATRQPYVEALRTARYDFGGNVQQVLGGRFILTARFSVSEQNHRHQFGEDIERDRHELLFGELSIKGTSGRDPSGRRFRASARCLSPTRRSPVHVHLCYARAVCPRRSHFSLLVDRIGQRPRGLS